MEVEETNTNTKEVEKNHTQQKQLIIVLTILPSTPGFRQQHKAFKFLLYLLFLHH